MQSKLTNKTNEKPDNLVLLSPPSAVEVQDLSQEEPETAAMILLEQVNDLYDLREGILQDLLPLIRKRAEVANAIKEKTYELYNADQVVGSNAEKREAKLYELLKAELPEDKTPAALAKLDADIECLKLLLQFYNEEGKMLRSVMTLFSWEEIDDSGN